MFCCGKTVLPSVLWYMGVYVQKVTTAQMSGSVEPQASCTQHNWQDTDTAQLSSAGLHIETPSPSVSTIGKILTYLSSAQLVCTIRLRHVPQTATRSEAWAMAPNLVANTDPASQLHPAVQPCQQNTGAFQGQWACHKAAH